MSGTSNETGFGRCKVWVYRRGFEQFLPATEGTRGPVHPPVRTEHLTVFVGLSVALGLVFAACGAVVWRSQHSDVTLAVRLPRDRLAGEILGVICLAWSAYHGCQMLEGGLATYRKIVWVAVPVVAILSYYHLDYLCARAAGGLLVLCASSLLHGAFAEMVPYRPAYCAVCYLVGLLGMAMMAVPWRFRDLLCALTPGSRWKCAFGVLNFVIGATLVVFPVLPRQP